MADSSVSITQGSGTSIDTRTESTNSNHRQVIVVGDPSTNGGVAPVDASTGLSVNVTNTTIAVTDNSSTLSIDDNGSSITVDGTVAATQSGTWNITNVSGTVSLPTGASTLAEQQTQTTAISAIKTSVELIDDAVYTDGSGTPSKAIAVAGTDGTNPQIISTNATGHVNIADGGNTITVDGTVAATQSGTWNITNVSGTVSLPTGASTSAKQDTMITSLQLIDDAIYADATGTPDKGVAIMGTDGTNPQLVSVTSAGLVNIADGGGNISIDDGGNTITVDGTITANLGTLNGAATAAKQPALGTAGSASSDVITVQGISSMTALKVDGTGGTFPVSGTVTANAGTGFAPLITDGSAAGTVGVHILGTDGTNGQILSTNSSGHLNIADGGNTITVDGTVTVNALPTGTNIIGSVKLTDGTDTADILDLSNSNPLTVAIVDTNGDQISSFGGGTQYTEGDTDASITGTAILWEDGSNTLRAASSAKPFPVEIIAGAGSGGTAAADDADFTAGTTSATPIMGVYESTPSSVTDGDLGTVGITVGRRMKTSATIDTALPAGTNNIGDVDVLSLPTLANVTTLGTITNVVHVDDNASTLSVDDGAGSITVDGTVTVTQTTSSNLKAQVQGFTSHDAVDADNPLKIGGKANSSAPANVAAGDRVDAFFDLAGRLKVDGSDVTQPVSIASVPSHAVTNAGTFAVQSAQSGTYSVRPDSYATDDTAMPATPLVVPVAGEYRNSATTYTDGDATVLQSDVNGYLKVNVAAGGTSGTQYTEGDTDATITGTAILWENTSDTLATVNETTPLPTRQYVSGGLLVGSNPNDDTQATSGLSLRNIGFNYAFNGTDWVRVRGDVSNGLDVDVTRVGGTVAVTQSGTWDEVGINDSGNSITVDNGGTFVVQENGAALTALQVIDNPVVVDDAAFTPATTSVMMAGFEFDDSTPDSVNEGDAGAARMSANRNIYTTLRDAAGNERGANINASNQLSVSVDNTVTVASHAVTNAGTFAVQAAQSGTWTLGANSGVDIGDVTLNNLTTTPVYTQHNLTGLGHGVKTVTTAGTDEALAGSTACKKVVIQAQTDNTSGVAIGATGVDATIATGNGVLLYPGDSIEIEIDNLADIYVDSLVNGEGVRYTYFT